MEHTCSPTGITAHSMDANDHRYRSGAGGTTSSEHGRKSLSESEAVWSHGTRMSSQRPTTCRPSFDTAASCRAPARCARMKILKKASYGTELLHKDLQNRAQQAVRAAEAAHSSESSIVAPIDGVLAGIALCQSSRLRQERGKPSRTEHRAPLAPSPEHLTHRCSTLKVTSHRGHRAAMAGPRSSAL